MPAQRQAVLFEDEKLPENLAGIVWVKKEAHLVPMPKSWSLVYLFAPSPQKAGRTIRYGEAGTDKEVIFYVGGFHALGNDDRICPALNVDHLLAALVILSYLKEQRNLKRSYGPEESIPSEHRSVSFPMNGFSKRFAFSRGGAFSRHLSQLIGDLKDTWIRMEHIKSGVTVDYTILGEVNIYRRPAGRRDARSVRMPEQRELHLNNVVLSEYFFRMLLNAPEVLWIRLDVVKKLRSRLAKAMYVVLASRAFHRTEADPWTINTVTLLTKFDYGKIPPKSKRAQIFTQHKPHSILEQLDGVEMNGGRFRIKMVDIGADWQIQVWRDVVATEEVKEEGKSEAVIRQESKTLKTWLQGGGTLEEYQRRTQRPTELSTYEMEHLTKAGIDFTKDLCYYRLAKAIIGEAAFESLCAEIHDNRQAPSFIIRKSLAHVLGGRLRDAIKEAARAYGRKLAQEKAARNS